MLNLPERHSPPLPPLLILIRLTMFFKEPAHLVISASWQNIKNLIGNFEAIHVGIRHSKFETSSFTGVGGE